jgi:legumain
MTKPYSLRAAARLSLQLFVFYSDHGAAGVLGMPTGPFLYADEFIKTLKKKHSRKGFKEAVL